MSSTCCICMSFLNFHRDATDSEALYFEKGMPFAFSGAVEERGSRVSDRVPLPVLGVVRRKEGKPRAKLTDTYIKNVRIMRPVDSFVVSRIVGRYPMAPHSVLVSLVAVRDTEIHSDSFDKNPAFTVSAHHTLYYASTKSEHCESTGRNVGWLTSSTRNGPLHGLMETQADRILFTAENAYQYSTGNELQ